MSRFALLTLVAVAFLAACGDDDEQPTSGDPNTAVTTDGGGDPNTGSGPIEVEVTADGFEPASAKVTIGQAVNFTNADSEPHTIVVPSGREQVVEVGETFAFSEEGCCAATFTDKGTGAEFEVVVSPGAAGLSD